MMKTLKYGMRGAEIRELQAELNRHGARLDVDGSYGWRTLRAVWTVQRSHRLKVDGLVGPNSQRVIWGSYIIDRRTGLHVKYVSPLDLKLHLEDTSGRACGLHNFINASFVWWRGDGSSYPTSIVAYKGVAYRNAQPNGYTWQCKPHYTYGAPTPTLIIKTDGSVTIEDISHLDHSTLWRTHLAVSGIRICPHVESTGFAPYVDFGTVAYKTSRIAIGVDEHGQIALCYHRRASAWQMSNLLTSIGIRDAISLDSGGSANYAVDGRKISATSRRMAAFLTW